MRSVADDLRRATRDETAALSPGERVDRALRLGDEDAATFAAARTITIDEARRELMRRRAAGRRESRCLSSLLR